VHDGTFGRVSRRTVVAGAAAAGATWAVPVVLSTPAAAQGTPVAGCTLLDVTSTPVCTLDPSLPYGVELTASVAGCTSGDHRMEVLQGAVVIGCLTLPSGGGVLGRIVADSPRTNEVLTLNLYAGTTCTGSVIGTDTVTVSTPTDCPAGGARIEGSAGTVDDPTLRFP
jgi:hypothetical protein